uniref:Uncharacterized protein n=1 Tax=Arundo donax TaxID=35708 RepID=A0A0A9A084_ARUDO
MSALGKSQNSPAHRSSHTVPVTCWVISWHIGLAGFVWVTELHNANLPSPKLAAIGCDEHEGRGLLLDPLLMRHDPVWHQGISFISKFDLVLCLVLLPFSS